MQTVSTKIITKTMTPTSLEDAYSLQKSKGWVWLQKLCFFILDKIGANKIETVECITYRNLNSPDLVAAIIEATNSIARSGPPNMSEFVAVVGRDEFIRLTQNTDLRHCFVSQLDVDLRWSDGLSRFDVGGIIVVFVPWVSGLAIIPASALGRRR